MTNHIEDTQYRRLCRFDFESFKRRRPDRVVGCVADEALLNSREVSDEQGVPASVLPRRKDQLDSRDERYKDSDGQQ